jgi:hypothetical protein
MRSPGVFNTLRFGSGVAGVDTTNEFVAQRHQQLHCRFPVWVEGRLPVNPGLRVRERLEDAATAAHGALDQSSIDQEQKHDGSLVKRHGRPIRGTGQIVLEMQTRVADRLVEESCTVLVILVQAIMSELAPPLACQVADN